MGETTNWKTKRVGQYVSVMQKNVTFEFIHVFNIKHGIMMLKSKLITNPTWNLF